MNIIVLLVKILLMCLCKRLNKILHNFAIVPRQKIIALTYDEKREHDAKTVCFLCDEKFNETVKKFKSEIIVIIQENSEVLVTY